MERMYPLPFEGGKLPQDCPSTVVYLTRPRPQLVRARRFYSSRLSLLPDRLAATLATRLAAPVSPSAAF